VYFLLVEGSICQKIPGGQFVEFHLKGERLLGHGLVGGVVVGRQVLVGQRLFNGDTFARIEGQEPAQQVESGCVSLQENKVFVKSCQFPQYYNFSTKAFPPLFGKWH